MDISKEYIKMCKKAYEIQKTWDPKVYDYKYHERIGKYKNHISVVRQEEWTKV